MLMYESISFATVGLGLLIMQWNALPPTGI